MTTFNLENSACMGYELTLADRLFKLGARPPVVRALCPIGKKTAIRLYKIIHQQSPKQGMLPYDPNWIINSAVQNIHASIFLGLIQDCCQLFNQAKLTAEILITAYELYCRVVVNNPKPSKLESSSSSSILLDINRAWQLTTQLISNEMQLANCKKCLARFVMLNNTPKSFQQCPICDVWIDRTGRHRWKKVITQYKTN